MFEGLFFPRTQLLKQWVMTPFGEAKLNVVTTKKHSQGKRLQAHHRLPVCNELICGVLEVHTRVVLHRVTAASILSNIPALHHVRHCTTHHGQTLPATPQLTFETPVCYELQCFAVHTFSAPSET